MANIQLSWPELMFVADITLSISLNQYGMVLVWDFPTRTSLVVDNSNWNVFHVSSCSSSSFVWGFNKTLTPLKIIGKKIQSVVQIKFINIMLPEVPRMMGECCNGLTSIFCYKYSLHSQINEHKISWNIKNVQYIRRFEDFCKNCNLYFWKAIAYM